MNLNETNVLISILVGVASIYTLYLKIGEDSKKRASENAELKTLITLKNEELDELKDDLSELATKSNDIELQVINLNSKMEKEIVIISKDIQLIQKIVDKLLLENYNESDKNLVEWSVNKNDELHKDK